MRALDIIEAEHANMRRLASALGALAETIGGGASAADLHTADLIIAYFETFTERFHHPKEDDFLFARLRQRSNAAGAVLDRLHRDHEMGPRQLETMKRMLLEPGIAAAPQIGRLVAEIHSFRQHLDEHMRLEEEGTFALAREALTAEDWDDVDAAFAAHADPLDVAHGDARIAELRERITQLLPAPFGLGGQRDVLPIAGRRAVAAPTGEPMLAVRGISTRYGRIEALRDVSLEVHAGQLVVLVGANGAGKTTLLRCLSGVQPVTGGDVTFAGRTMTRLAPEARVRAGICQVPEGRQVFAPMSIEDNLLMGAHTRPAGEIASGLGEIYALFPVLEEKRRLPAGTLSGGQQQMLALGRALMGKPRLLLLDEPSMGLAPLIVEEIFRIVCRLRDSGITILLVEQNARAALAIADRGYVMETGRILLSGTGPDLLDNEQVKKAYLGM
ncbi:MAG: ATP-binding cassette domain-containing protein [Rhodospirillales bacterium]|nr:ATP-binding cassette domain-containing protein [Rhodospirillales bacterium]MDE2199491.1 ATP-binding cassette domain-containing protein [Rhodospirillales bacterium]MDE2575795.1 ATP-binding cassette domain-containing protein [Rhodospirillales bacterium]